MNEQEMIARIRQLEDRVRELEKAIDEADGILLSVVNKLNKKGIVVGDEYKV